jgi:hypothetical protein
MKKSGITQPRGTAEFVVEHARWQLSRGRNPSEPFESIQNPREALTVALRALHGMCGCGGFIELGLGCTRYLGSEVHDFDVMSEGMMRSGGLGFGVALDPGEAIMSMHLQTNGLSFERSEAVLCAARVA